MANQQETAAAKQEPIPDSLLVVGNPVVVTGKGDRLSLSGELTSEQRESLGDAKLRSLMNAGHLRTQEQLDAADEMRTRLVDQQKAMRGHINPNFGTPSMTPEAAAKHEAPALDQGSRQEKDSGGNTDVNATPVSELELSNATREALESAGFKTVGDIINYGAENEGLAGNVEGIGEAREKEVQAAIGKLGK